MADYQGSFDRACLRCGAPFHVELNQAKKGWGKFCSRSCIHAPPSERFWAMVQKTETCWLWTGTTGIKGYGRFRSAGKLWMAHRWAYESIIGAIPDGFQIDHVKDRGCTSKRCVNPSHLEIVTCQENIHRSGRADIAIHKAGICAAGHVMHTLPNGHHRCRVCAIRRATKAYYANRDSILSRQRDARLEKKSRGMGK